MWDEGHLIITECLSFGLVAFSLYVTILSVISTGTHKCLPVNNTEMHAHYCCGTWESYPDHLGAPLSRCGDVGEEELSQVPELISSLEPQEGGAQAVAATAEHYYTMTSSIMHDDITMTSRVILLS